MDIPKKMKAAVLYDFNDVRVEERDVPEPGPEDVLVKVESCGICGTDVKVVTQGMPKMPPMGDFIIGHEYSGTVVKTGETVDEFKPGDRVAVEVHKGCGRCKNCLLGDYTACMNYGDKGNVPFGYDEFEHVARIGFTSMPIAVRADAPYQSLEEFVEYAQENPGKVKIGNAGTGSATHLTAVVFAEAAGLDVTHVPLGADRRMPAILGGEVNAVCVPLPEVAPHVDSGDVKIIAFPTQERNDNYPDAPTLVEEGYEVVIELFRGISVPKGTPESRIRKLEDAFRQAAQTDAFKDSADKFGFQVDFMPRDEFEDYLAVQNELIAEGMRAGGLVE